MRYIVKSADPPASIREWLVDQRPVGLNLDYRSFNDKPALRRELIAEQYGLYAYTGTPIEIAHDSTSSLLLPTNRTLRNGLRENYVPFVCRTEARNNLVIRIPRVLEKRTLL